MFPRFNNLGTISPLVMMSLPHEATTDPETMVLQNNICSLQQQLSQITERLTMGRMPNTEREYLKAVRSQLTADFDAIVFKRDELISVITTKAQMRSFGEHAGFSFRSQEHPTTEENRVDARQNERRFRTSSALTEEGMCSFEYQELRRAMSEITERLTKLESNFPTAEDKTTLPATPT